MIRLRQVGAVGLCVVAVLGSAAACSGPAQRAVVPTLRGAPSDERPPWLRELPQPIERYPAPQGWGGDNLAARQIGMGAG